MDEGYVPPARQQGDCGSCYIMATIAMIETRLRIKYKSFKDSNMRLSVQHPLDCSYYNQGCDGGFPFLVEKFASEFELVRESCSRYNGINGDCNTCNVNEEEEL